MNENERTVKWIKSEQIDIFIQIVLSTSGYDK